MTGLHDRASGFPAATPVCSHPLQGSDTLSDVLQAVRLNGALFFLVNASTPWLAEAPNSDALAPVILPRAQHVVSFHLLTRGACWCRMPGASTFIEAGDVIVVPHGDEYALCSDPTLSGGLTLDQTLGWFQQMATGQLPMIVDEGGGGPERIGIVCGFLGCDALPFNPVLAALPRLVHVRPSEAAVDDRLSMLIEFAVAESRDKQAGGRSVLLRADVR
jgi:hypothetical protein